MTSYIVRRVLQFIPVFFTATFVIFFLMFELPGDPIQTLAGEKPIPPAVRSALYDRYNIDDPLLVQYGKYMGVVRDGKPRCTTDPKQRVLVNRGERRADVCFSGVLQGDLGESLSQRDVSQILLQKVPTTARLTVMAFTIEVVLGITAGVVAALRKGRFLDSLVLVTTTAVIAIPVFVLGYAAQITFGVKLGWFPVSSATGSFRSLILPAAVLGSGSLAYIARLARTSLAENLRADYVRTATAKGLSRSRVVSRHALRNSLIPVVTYLGIDLGQLMAGAIMTEAIFNVPGVGTEVFRAVQAREGAVVVGLVTFMVTVYMAANLIVDVMYAWLDPRIRYDAH